MAITLTVADSPRLVPIATGSVRPEGAELTLVLAKVASGPAGPPWRSSWIRSTAPEEDFSEHLES